LQDCRIELIELQDCGIELQDRRILEPAAIPCTTAFVQLSSELLARGDRVRFRAEGWSMHPTIRHGELITVESVNASEIGRGDILLYRTGQRVFAHRVVGMRRIEGALSLTLRGDGTNVRDAPISAGQVIGRVIAVERDGRSIALAGAQARWRKRIAGLQDCRIAGLTAFHDLAASALARRQSTFDLLDRQTAFIRWASVEGLAGLLLQATSDDPGWAIVRGELREAALRQAAVAILQEQELRRVLDGLAHDAVQPLVFKGAALAYTIYPEPALRPRMDTDLLIRDQDTPSVRLALERLGYEQDCETSGPLVTSQFHYTRSDALGVRHALDVHVKIANVQAYADRLTYDELRREAVSLPRLGPGAIGPSAVHALFIACVHRIAHHWDEPTLLWLYDIHLLARSLDRSAWNQALRSAAAKELSSVVRLGLARAGEAFGPCAPPGVMAHLDESATHESAQPLFDATTRTIDVVLSDLASLAGGRARLQLLREHLFPPIAYMQQRYAGCPTAFLPFTYAYRIVRGAPRWLRRARQA
jgi:signal peptidase I